MHACFDQVYTNLEGNRANLVHTAWALLSLIDAGQVSIITTYTRHAYMHAVSITNMFLLIISWLFLFYYRKK